jgi:hypothetical protein
MGSEANHLATEKVVSPVRSPDASLRSAIALSLEGMTFPVLG